MNEKKRKEIKELIKSRWDLYETNVARAKALEHYYIFGTWDIASVKRENELYPRNEHLLIDDLVSLVNAVDLELNPVKEFEDAPDK